MPGWGQAHEPVISTGSTGDLARAVARLRALGVRGGETIAEVLDRAADAIEDRHVREVPLGRRYGDG